MARTHPLVSGFMFETCCKCKVEFAMSSETYDTMQRMKEQGTFYCPLGHQQHYVTGETELDKMRRRAERAEQQNARLKDEADAAKRRVVAARGQVTRIKNRVGNGVCPCCNRTFSNLQRHMSTQHKDYKAEAA